ncbi:MAG: ACT domain-containing protein [Phaeodactylibacter sp.]|nr:ACT domain-containing protein [Phaeodactylibacter sp.]
MEKKVGITDLEALITNMEPVLNEGEYVFATVPNTASIPRESTVCEIKEKEGITVVVSKEDAAALGLPFEYVASWITLNIHSSLEAVGLTAAFSSALAQNNISCNVIAGYYHDHIFVDKKDKDKAVKVLRAMSEKTGSNP